MGDETPLRRFCWCVARLEAALKALKALPPAARQRWLPQLHTEYDAVSSCGNKCVNKVERLPLPPIVLSAWNEMAETDIDIKQLDFSRLSETYGNGPPMFFPEGALEWHDGCDEDRWWRSLDASAPGVSPRTGPQNLVEHDGSLDGPQPERPLAHKDPPTVHAGQVRDNHGLDHPQRPPSPFDDPRTEDAEQNPVERGSADSRANRPEIQDVPSCGKRQRAEGDSPSRSSIIQQQDPMDEDESDDDRPIRQKSVVPIQVKAGPSAPANRVEMQVARTANDADQDTFQGQQVDAFLADVTESQPDGEQESVEAGGNNVEHGPNAAEMVHEGLDPALEPHGVYPSRLGHRRSRSATNPANGEKRKRPDSDSEEEVTEPPHMPNKRGTSGPNDRKRTPGQSSVLDTNEDVREPPSKRKKQTSVEKQAVDDVASMVTHRGDNQAVFVGKGQEGKEVLRHPVYLEWVDTIKKIKLSKCDYCNRKGLTCKDNLACQSCPPCSQGKKTCSHRAKDAGTGTKKVYRPNQYLSVLKLHAVEPYPALPDIITTADATTKVHTLPNDAPPRHLDTLAPDEDHHHVTSSSLSPDSSLKRTRAQTRKAQGLGDVHNTNGEQAVPIQKPQKVAGSALGSTVFPSQMVPHTPGMPQQAAVERASTTETNPSRDKGKQRAVRVSPPIPRVSPASSCVPSPEADILPRKPKGNQKSRQVSPATHSSSSRTTFSTPNPGPQLSEAASLRGHLNTIVTDIKRIDSDAASLAGVCHQIRSGLEQMEGVCHQIRSSQEQMEARMVLIEEKLDLLLAMERARG